MTVLKAENAALMADGMAEKLCRRCQGWPLEDRWGKAGRPRRGPSPNRSTSPYLPATVKVGVAAATASGSVRLDQPAALQLHRVGLALPALEGADDRHGLSLADRQQRLHLLGAEPAVDAVDVHPGVAVPLLLHQFDAAPQRHRLAAVPPHRHDAVLRLDHLLLERGRLHDARRVAAPVGLLVRP